MLVTLHGYLAWTDELIDVFQAFRCIFEFRETVVTPKVTEPKR